MIAFNVYGTEYLQPMLTRDGIQCQFYCRLADGTIRGTEYYFDGAGAESVFNSKYTRRYRATIENLEKFIALDLPPEYLRSAYELLLERRDTIPMMLDSFHIQRATSVNLDKSTPLHRVPHDYIESNGLLPVTKRSVKTTYYTEPVSRQAHAKIFKARKVSRTVPAPLTRAEMTMQRLGMPFKPRYETVTSTTVDVTPYTTYYTKHELRKREEPFEYTTHEPGVLTEKLPVLREWYKWSTNYKPFSQQLIGAEFAYRIKRWAIWYTMRTGKTLCAIMAAKRLLAERKIDRVVVVCPLNIMWVTWARELELERIPPTVIDGTLEQDTDAIYDGSQVYLLNYERIESRLDLMKNAWDMSRTMIVADETGAIKTSDSNRSRAMHALCKFSDRVILLNGSPMEEWPTHLWSQMYCLDPEGTWFDFDYNRYVKNNLVAYAVGKYQPIDMRAFTRLVETTSIRYTTAEADQYNGKDTQLRYIRIKATRHQVNQAAAAALGFMRSEETGEVKETNSHLLSVMNQLREICCGTDKWKEGGIYQRAAHDTDPKLAWIVGYLLTTTDPIVVFTEFNWFEDQLKQLLDEHEIKWRSTRTKGKTTVCYRLTESASMRMWSQVWQPAHEYIQEQYDLDDDPDYPRNVEDELSFRYHPKVVEWARANRPFDVEQYQGWEPGKKLKSKERADAIDDFNNGECRVFICKTREGRGFALHRKPAVTAGIGEWPSIIFTAPGWELASYDQAKARCMTTDPKTQNSVCTQVFALSIAGSIEDKMYDALRNKASFAEQALKDADRVGHQAFVDERRAVNRTAGGKTGQVSYCDHV